MECGVSVTVARRATSSEEWFNSTLPLKIYPGFPPEQAMKFRKKYVRGFIVPGGCNYYIAVGNGNSIFGLLGLLKPDYGDYDLLLKADITNGNPRSIDLLLYALRTVEVKTALEKKFNREIKTVISKCFSNHEVISRYRKHAELVNKTKADGGYDLTYRFIMGEVPSLKAAKALWLQKRK